MAQSGSDKYVYFTVGILKDSTALEALKQDALTHHMIDQPGQLIALRITEYYEMMNSGIVQPVVRVPAILAQIEPEEELPITPLHTTMPSQSAPVFTPMASQPQEPAPASNGRVEHGKSFVDQFTGRMRALRRENDVIIPASPSVEQNADEAADYWSIL